MASVKAAYMGGMPPGENIEKPVERNPNRKAVLIGKPIDDYDLKRMHTVLRSKFAFYLQPTTKVSEAQTGSRKRLEELRKQAKADKQREILELEHSMQAISSASSMKNKTMTLVEQETVLREEKEKHERLIGQLKAAEARNRTRLLKMRYVNLKEDETEHIVDSQPTALKAARLEAFLPTFKKKYELNDSLNPIQRRRLEAIIDGALIERKLN